MSKIVKKAVFILRGEPYHNEHERIILDGLGKADEIIVLIGSSFRALDPKNPFSYEQRKHMIQTSSKLDKVGIRDRISVKPLRDYLYNEALWMNAVQSHVGDEKSVGILGSNKDKSSYYINNFSHWKQLVGKVSQPLDATEIRERFFTNPDSDFIKKNVPDSTLGMLNLIASTHVHTYLKEEYESFKAYDALWAGAPYKPIFTTTDTVVTCQGHVLLVKRKSRPGKGLWALPGGFLDASLHIQESAIKSLKKETSIELKPLLLESNIKDSHVFDHPNRSLRGRTVTHGFSIPLKFNRLPEVKGTEEVENAIWMPFYKVRDNEELMFEDHMDIINYFTGI